MIYLSDRELTENSMEYFIGQEITLDNCLYRNW